MASVLHLASQQSISRRGSPRRAIRLELDGVKTERGDIQIVVHDLSVAGLLIETDAPLAVGDIIQIDMPEGGAVDTEIMWSSGRFHGCQFDEAMSNRALSAALLQSSFGFSRPDLARQTKVIAGAIGRLPDAAPEPAVRRGLTPLARAAAIFGLATGLWAPVVFGAFYAFA